MLCLGTAAFASGSLTLTRQHAYNTLIGAHAVILAGQVRNVSCLCLLSFTTCVVLQLFQRFINDVPVPNLPIIFTGLTLLPLVLGNQNTLPKDLVMTGLGAAFTLRSLFFMINPSAVANNLLTAGHMPVLVNSLRLSSSMVMTYSILLVATGYLYLSTAGTAPKRFKLAAAVGNAVAAVASVVLSPPSFMLAVFHGILALVLGLEVAQQ